jgi:hypothetical protein
MIIEVLLSLQTPACLALIPEVESRRRLIIPTAHPSIR